MSVSYKNMKAFLQVAQSNTFAEAAEQLCISQPALSTAIKNMEAQLEGKLFVRTTRKIELTPEGRIFLPKVKRVLEDYDGVIDDVKTLFTAQQGSLVISSMPSFAEGHLAELIAKFTLFHPNINIRILDVVMERVIENVVAERADIGFVFEPPQRQGISFNALFNDQFCLVMPKNHILANNNNIHLNDLCNIPFISMNRGSSIRQWIDQALLSNKIELKTALEASQLGTIGQIVSRGLGVSIVPQLCVEQMESRKLICRPIVDLKINKQVGTIVKSPSNLSVAATLFNDFLNSQSDIEDDVFSTLTDPHDSAKP